MTIYSKDLITYFLLKPYNYSSIFCYGICLYVFNMCTEQWQKLDVRLEDKQSIIY